MAIALLSPSLPPFSVTALESQWGFLLLAGKMGGWGIQKRKQLLVLQMQTRIGLEGPEKA